MMNLRIGFKKAITFSLEDDRLSGFDYWILIT